MTLNRDALNGQFGAKTRTISIDNATYEIDLNDKTVDRLFAQIIAKGFYKEPVAKKSRKKNRSARTDSARNDRELVRTWLVENGYEVKDRGRIKNDYLNAYMAATGVKLAGLPKMSQARNNLVEVRAWLMDNGYSVGVRGRIKAELLDAYTDATGNVVEHDNYSYKETAKSRSRRVSSSNNLMEVRQWLMDNGYSVGVRGRIKAELLDAYNTATGSNVICEEKPRKAYVPSRESKLRNTEVTVARQWLKDNGYEVKDRGRIKAEFWDAYEARVVA